ncbi:NAD-dependent deacylase [bacterium]|nr:NAD-dependent deacylase [bacterium]MBU1653060.1 NAD-dependent deacylase [bacterium]
MELSEIDQINLSAADLKSIAVLTGAGISAESGIPTFRGKEGLWKQFRPEELATPQAFFHDPKLVWDWYFYRRNLIAQAEPNAGHFALVELEKMLRESFTLITQNVDGLHRQAGSSNPIELHGNIFVNRCHECASHFSDDEIDFSEMPPLCPACRGPVRPGVVWFGENLNPIHLEDAFAKSHQATLFLSIGTSTVVHPAASLPEIARRGDAKIIEINPDSTPISHAADYTIRDSSANALPPLIEKIRSIFAVD